jgi:hypothetical protein
LRRGLANSSLARQIAPQHNSTLRKTTAIQYDYLNRLGSIASSPSNSFAYHFLGRVMLRRTLIFPNCIATLNPAHALLDTGKEKLTFALAALVVPGALFNRDIGVIAFCYDGFAEI